MKKMSSDYFLIVDYNLSRYGDVLNIKNYVNRCYHMSTILIRNNPSDIDNTVADIVLNLNLLAADFVETAYRELSPYSSSIHAGIIFSDNAVYNGAKLLEKLGLTVDNAELAKNAFSKEAYRLAEKKYRNLLEAQNIFLPFSKKIKNYAELEKFSKKYSDGFVLKPSCEGNNRGVIKLNKGSNLEKAYSEIDKYIKDGVVCEELIPFDLEFSFDGVANLSFITMKWSLNQYYPLEKAQIIPAIINDIEKEKIQRAGQLANLLIGQLNGPFHNEIKLSDDAEYAAIVEPNRRPAGMKIWDLAKQVYGLDFYQIWIDKVFGKAIPACLPTPKKRAAILMLSASKSGRLAQNRDNALSDVVALFFSKHKNYRGKIKWYGFSWLKSLEESISDNPDDNSGYIASIFVETSEMDLNMLEVLKAFDGCWQGIISKYIPNQLQNAS